MGLVNQRRVGKGVLIRMVLTSTESGEYEERYDRLKWARQYRQNLPGNLILYYTVRQIVAVW